MAQSYENLEIWKNGIELAELIYFTTKKFPKDEMFGVVSQIRRAVVSISANIAEGSGRNSKKDFCRFIDISIGSLNEVESLLTISFKLKYVSDNEYDKIKEIIKKSGSLLGGFRKYLNN